MNIGQASKASGVTTKMIRYYDEIGLVRPASRTDSNYREYDARQINELRFIKRARSLGFSIKQIQALLALWDDPHRASAEVKQLALAHAAELEQKIRELQAMQRTLRSLAQRCHGDARPTCPILEELAAGE